MGKEQVGVLTQECDAGQVSTDFVIEQRCDKVDMNARLVFHLYPLF